MGIVTIFMALAAWGGSAAFLWIEAGPLVGAIECVLVVAGLLTSSLVYCTHCPLHKKGCMHLFVGVPARLCKDRCSEPYTLLHEIVVLVPLAAATLFPQYWLIRSLPLFAGFWVLMILTGVLIVATVCPGCGNTRCGVKKLIDRR